MKITVEQALQKGIEAHKAGRVTEADRFYTSILSVNPNHPDANHNMGVLAVGLGKVSDALPFLKRALDAQPNIPQFWKSFIEALIKMGRLNEAEASIALAKDNGVNEETLEKFKLFITEKKKSKRDPGQIIADKKIFYLNFH